MRAACNSLYQFEFGWEILEDQPFSDANFLSNLAGCRSGYTLLGKEFYCRFQDLLAAG
jgi:hypothetical protein